MQLRWGLRRVRRGYDNRSDQRRDNNNFEDRAPSFLCDGSMVIYHSDAALTRLTPASVSCSKSIPAAGWSSNTPERLTEQVTADDIYPVADPHDEINSKEVVLLRILVTNLSGRFLVLPQEIAERQESLRLKLSFL